MNPKKRVNTYNIRSKSMLNTLPVSLGISKIHAKIKFKRQFILKMSLVSKNDEYTETNKNIITACKRQGGNNVPHDKGGTNRRTYWLLRF